MDSQLEAIQQRVCTVEGRLIRAEQDLAAAEQAGNKEKESKLFDLLLSLNNQLLSLNNQLGGLQEKENILLRGQAPGKPCLQLVFS